MNKILNVLFAILILLPGLAHAQSSVYQRNDSAATTLQNTNLQPSKAAVNNKGRVFGSVILEAGSAIVGQVGIDQTTPGTTNRVSIGTDGTIGITSVVPGTGDTNLGIAEDAIVNNGRTLVPIAVQRADVEADTTTTNGDAATLHEYDGRLSTTDRDRIATGTLDMTSAASTGSIDVDGMASVSLFFTRTTETGTVRLQASTNGSTWYNLVPVAQDENGPLLAAVSSNNNGVLSVSNAYLYTVTCAGYRTIRISVVATGAGTVLPYTLRASQGQNTIGIAGIVPGVGALNLAKREDDGHTTGDVGVPAWAVRNSTLTSFTGSDFDYSPIGVTANGAVLGVLVAANVTGTAVKTEGSSPADGDGLVITAFVREDALTANTGATNQLTWGKVDSSGRQVVTNAPPGETWSACSASNTGTSDTAIKAAVASNRIYVTSLSCFNTAAVASSIAFKDGATQIYVGGVSNSTLQGVAYYEHSLPTPLRLTSATAFNFAMGTTATATTCCGAGYISTQ